MDLAHFCDDHLFSAKLKTHKNLQETPQSTHTHLETQRTKNGCVADIAI